MSRMRGEDVPRSRPGAKTAWGGSSPSLAALARLGAGARYAKLWGEALSPTSRQHAYKSAVLALGLPSYPRYHVRLTIHFLLCHLFLHICEVRSCVCLSK